MNERDVNIKQLLTSFDKTMPSPLKFNIRVQVKVTHCLQSVRLVGRFVGLKLSEPLSKEGIDCRVTVKGGGPRM